VDEGLRNAIARSADNPLTWEGDVQGDVRVAFSHGPDELGGASRAPPGRGAGERYRAPLAAIGKQLAVPVTGSPGRFQNPPLRLGASFPSGPRHDGQDWRARS
jgi:hypothetical protein